MTTELGYAGGPYDLEVGNGQLAFEPGPGQSCLDVVNDAGSSCSAATLNTILSNCSFTAILSPSVALGGVCDGDWDCIPPSDTDGGPGLGPLFGCDFQTSVNTLTCGGICSYGHALGESCASSGNGGGCVDGYCRDSLFFDGGTTLFCAPYTPVGQSCIDAVCDPAATCLRVQDGGSICSTLGVAGSPCSVGDCEGANCVCALGFFCSLPSDGGGDTGACAPVSPGGGACLFADCENFSNFTPNCACDFTQAYCDAPDAGALGTCTPFGGVGTPCDFETCIEEARNCSCQSNTLCTAPPDGGEHGTCLAKGGVNAPCTWNTCTRVGESDCQCDATLNLYCSTSQSICLPRAGLLDTCNLDGYSYNSCDDGLNCAQDDQCFVATPGLGDACAPASGATCSAGLICSNNQMGTCIASASALGQPCDPVASPSDCDGIYQCLATFADGGGVCGANAPSGASCRTDGTGCRLLVDCVYGADGGSGFACEAESPNGGPCDSRNLVGDPCPLGYCDPSSLRCLAPLSTGDTCSGLPASACGAAAQCSNGTCTLNCDVTDG